MSLRILIGHELPGQRGQASTLYIGDSGQALEQVKAANTTSASFTILNNPLGIRKSNPRYVAPVVVKDQEQPAPADTPPKSKGKARE